MTCRKSFINPFYRCCMRCRENFFAVIFAFFSVVAENMNIKSFVFAILNHVLRSVAPAVPEDADSDGVSKAFDGFCAAVSVEFRAAVSV